MAVWNKKTVWSFMFLLAGVAGVDVNYQHPVCAVKGSTVTLPCTFTPETSFSQNRKEVPLRIVRVRWCVNHEICHETTPSVYDSNSTMPNSRYRYLGDMTGNCTLQIRNIQMIDNATFRFRMEADNVKGHYTGVSGVRVRVTGPLRMTINSSSDAGELRQKQKVTLSCTTTTCTVHQLKVAWFKDGSPLPQSGSALQLGPLTAKDSGNYTCGLKIYTKTNSPPYAVHVKEAEEKEKDGAGSDLPLIAGLVCGVLLLLFTLILVLFIIRRRRSAADDGQAAVGGELDQKHPDATYSSITEAAEQKRAERQQEVRPAAEDVNYAAVQFKHKNQARAAEEEVDAVIYSAVANRR